jgi:hypothetical protein
VLIFTGILGFGITAFLAADAAALPAAALPAAAPILPKPARAPRKKVFVWFLGKR